MLAHQAKDFSANDASHEVALMVKKVQLLLHDVHARMQDLAAEEVDPAVVTMKVET